MSRSKHYVPISSSISIENIDQPNANTNLSNVNSNYDTQKRSMNVKNNGNSYKCKKENKSKKNKNNFFMKVFFDLKYVNHHDI